METRDAFDDSELPNLIATALELRDSGEELCLEEICEGAPHLITALKRSLELSSQLPDLQRVSAGRDRLLGQTLESRYRLDARVGSGAMGVVYRGMDLDLERAVAIKILKLPFGDEDEAEVRFAREAETLAALRHQAVVNIFDRGRTPEDDPFLVMEFVEGLPLTVLLGEIKGTPGSTSSKDTQAIAKALGVDSLGEQSYLRAVVRWMAEVANGLAMAHSKGIFHRDIKPSNILIRGGEGPVVVDFGIAAQTGQATLTRDGALIGTPAFMAPEALQPGTPAGPALDIYGLTATLYELLTLRPPYSGTPTQVLSALSLHEPVPAGRIGEGLPQDLLAILDCGMARRPEDRYKSIAELEEDLRAFLDYRPVQARTLTTVGRFWRRVRRSPAWRAGIAVAGVAIAITIGFQAHAAWLENRQTEYLEVWKHIPPNLGVASPVTAVLTEAEGRDEVAKLLDKAVATSSEVLPATLLRGIFLGDHGEPEGAARDMARIARSLNTPYSRALEARYRSWADSGGSGAVDLSDLPEPEGGLDNYTATLFALRERRIADASRFLKDPDLEEYVPAQELATLLISDRAKQLARGIWLEERIGCRTANTAHLIGIAQTLSTNYLNAYEVMADGLALVPTSHPLHMNSARAAWMMGWVDTAREHYRQVIDLRPDNLQGHELHVRFLTETSHPGEAQLALDLIPFDEGDKWLALRHDLQGGIEA